MYVSLIYSGYHILYFKLCYLNPKCLRENHLNDKNCKCMCVSSTVYLFAVFIIRDSSYPPAHSMCIFTKPKYTTNVYRQIVQSSKKEPADSEYTLPNIYIYICHNIRHTIQIEKVQRSFTKFITGMRDCSYSDRPSLLRLYSLQRRRKCYCIMYVRKIIEDLVTRFSKPIVWITQSESRGRYCGVSHVNICTSGTLAYNSFRWHVIRLFNALPKCIRCTTSCYVYGFKHTLGSNLMNIVDHPCVPGFNNSLDGGDCIKWRTLCDDLATNYMLLNYQKYRETLHCVMFQYGRGHMASSAILVIL